MLVSQGQITRLVLEPVMSWLQAQTVTITPAISVFSSYTLKTNSLTVGISAVRFVQHSLNETFQSGF
jgi:hypothetical protein